MEFSERETTFDVREVGAHKFEQRNGRWWCTTENVDADECVDYERCAYGPCVCNDRSQGG